jgi:hypothetical protein
MVQTCMYMFTVLLVHTRMNMYVHGMYIYIQKYKCTYMFMNSNLCMYIVHTPMLIYVSTLYKHRLCSFTPTLHFTISLASGPISLATPASLSSAQAREPLLPSSCLPGRQAPVFSTDRPPRRGLPRPNCHSHWFTSYTS